MAGLPAVRAGGPQSVSVGLPRTFSLVATAAPLPPTANVRSIERVTEVALRTVPRADETFPIRAPRGVFVPGMCFVLAYEDINGVGRALVDVQSVNQTTSVSFQLVMARLIRPAQAAAKPEPAATFDRRVSLQVIDGEVAGPPFSALLTSIGDTSVDFTTGHALSIGTMLQIAEAAESGLTGAVLRVVRVQRGGPSNVYVATFEHASHGRAVMDASSTSSRRTIPGAGGPSPAVDRRAGAATATPVAVAGVRTIDAETSVTVHSPIELGVPLELSAPRGAISVGACFALRVYGRDGAKRGLVRVTGVQASAGMADAVEAVLLRATVPASEAESFRVRIDRFFVAEVVMEGSREVSGRLIDLSASGVGLMLGEARIGDRLRFRTAGSSLPGLDGAEVVIVRCDPRDPQRFGAQFTEPGRGRRAVATILDADRAERDRLREAKREAVRRSREIEAAAMLESLGRATDLADDGAADGSS